MPGKSCLSPVCLGAAAAMVMRQRPYTLTRHFCDWPDASHSIESIQPSRVTSDHELSGLMLGYGLSSQTAHLTAGCD